MKRKVLFFVIVSFYILVKQSFCQVPYTQVLNKTNNPPTEVKIKPVFLKDTDKISGDKNTINFVNDICIPSKLYMLLGVKNDLFVEPIIKRWRPYNDVVRFSGTGSFERRLQRVATINAPVDAGTITFTLINEDRFDTLKSFTATIVTGTPTVGDDSIAVSVIGDSFTNGAFFKDALLIKNYVPKIEMIGLRNIAGYPTQFDEGRGGWTLADYFNVSKNRTQAFNGFWQPTGDYKYWGATQFWKLANDIRLNPKKDWSFNESYNASRFGTQSLLFAPETGYKINPAQNDIMFDNTLGYYVKYDGTKWTKVTYEAYTWEFSYEKYLAMWNLKKPSILAEFLGLNDFANVPDPAKIDFKNWNKQIRILCSSYIKVVPNGKFVIMIPSSTCGILDNTAGDFTTKKNACMWELRKNIIDNFDKRESENIFIVDAAIAIDNVNGFNISTDKTYTNPYPEYAGNENIKVQTGNPHPYPNYPSMGISLAAFIQKYRSK